ncbi:MAG: hypothetical protein ACOC56_06505 [Atribacterota bacterium]
MTKNELVEKLKNIPTNLPVIIELDCDTFRSKEIKSIEVKKVVKSKYKDYSDSKYDLDDVSDDEIIEVIWIS